MDASAGSGGWLRGSAAAPGAVASALATASRAEDLRKGFAGKSAFSCSRRLNRGGLGRDFDASFACGALPELAEAREAVVLGVASGWEAARTGLDTGVPGAGGGGAATGADTTGALIGAPGAGSANACVAGCCSPPAGAGAKAGVSDLSPGETAALGSAGRSADAMVSAGAGFATSLSGIALATVGAATKSWLVCAAGARSAAAAEARAFTRRGAVSPKVAVRPKPAAISSPAPATAMAAALGVDTCGHRSLTGLEGCRVSEGQSSTSKGALPSTSRGSVPATVDGRSCVAASAFAASGSVRSRVDAASGA